MNIYSESAHYSSHFVAATLVSFWLTLCQTSAQSRETAFGQIRSSAIPTKVDKFTVHPAAGGLSNLYCWSFHGTVLTSASVDSSGQVSHWRVHALAAPIDEFMIIDFTYEHKNVGVGIDRVGKSLSFYDDLSGDSLMPVYVAALPIVPTNVAFGDLNNDKRTDFVVYDRETPGALPFFGLGNEHFKQGKIIAPDNAIGSLKLVHLNNDSLLDLVLYDWVRSELHFLYGVGQGKFLDQASTPIEGEVRDMKITPLLPGGNLDIVLSCRHPGKVEILRGDGLGDFTPSVRINLKDPFVSFSLADINNDGATDIVGVDGSSAMHVYLNGGDNTFDERIDFACGKDVTQFGLFEASSPGLPGVTMLDRGTQHIVSFENGAIPAILRDSLDLSTGVRPRGVALAEIGIEGRREVVVASGGSNAISFYSNGGGSFYGQTSYPLPASPHDVVFHSFLDSTARFLISYPESRQVSLFSLDETDRTSTNATISTERGVELLYWNGMRRQAIDFYTFSVPAASLPASMTLFREIGSHQFIEQNFRLLPTNTLLGAGVGRINDDQLPDVAYVYRNNTTGKCELAVSLADTAFTYRQKTFFVELADKNITRGYVWIVDAERSGHPDVFVLTASPTPMLQRLHWLKENTFSRPDTLAKDLRIVDGAQVAFVDVDRDGVLDIVINDQDRGEIGWLRARAGTYEPFRRLCSVPVHSHFAFGDLNDDGVPDLAVTLSDLGILRIYDGKTLIRMSLEKNR
ncbi:MAG TPA: VCBS repeat-containing protein [Bacteroidota bacterium]|nr:VCBS repeat-containing protein [Bacteroidota bacterium]